MRYILVAFICTWAAIAILFNMLITYNTTSKDGISKLWDEIDFWAIYSERQSKDFESNFEEIQFERVQDTFNLWVLTLSDREQKKLQSVFDDIASESIELDCIEDSTDFRVSKGEFVLYRGYANAVTLTPDGITCMKGWNTTDCRDFCEEGGDVV